MDLLEGDEEEVCEHTGTNHRAISEESERNERFWSKESFVEGKGNQAENTDHEHGDDHPGTPSVALVGGKGEW